MSDCAEYRAQLERLLDDPGAEATDDLVRHLDACPACRERFAGGRIELDATAFGALSPGERERMLDALARERAGGRPRAQRYFAAAVIVAAVGFSVWHIATREPGAAGSAVGLALVEDHIRYLGHPDRDEGSSRTALEAYLQAHVDFPVSLPEPPGTRLTGARRCYLLGRRVALAFYDTPQGPASYFVLSGDGLEQPRQPCAGERTLACSAHQGYHVVAWRDAGLVRAFVGPDERELTRLALALSGPAEDAGAN